VHLVRAGRPAVRDDVGGAKRVGCPKFTPKSKHKIHIFVLLMNYNTNIYEAIKRGKAPRKNFRITTTIRSIKEKDKVLREQTIHK
jgi:hypothetical protein